ncbi:hypothetical protein HDV05_001858, partial [Chytridiales sp. JEL 0842]
MRFLLLIPFLLSLSATTFTSITASPLPQVPVAASSYAFKRPSVLTPDAAEYPYGAPSASVSVARSSYFEDYQSRYSYRSYFVIDLAVKNSAYNKQVGIRFSNSSWASYDEAFATYVGKLDEKNGIETWQVLVDRGYRSPYAESTPEYEYAAFVSYDKKERIWDANNNYFVYRKATAKSPVRHLEDSV